MGGQPRRDGKDGEKSGLGRDTRYGKVLGEIIDCGYMGGYIWWFCGRSDRQTAPLRPQKKQNTPHNISGRCEQWLWRAVGIRYYGTIDKLVAAGGDGGWQI